MNDHTQIVVVVVVGVGVGVELSCSHLIEVIGVRVVLVGVRHEYGLVAVVVEQLVVGRYVVGRGGEHALLSLVGTPSELVVVVVVVEAFVAELSLQELLVLGVGLRLSVLK